MSDPIILEPGSSDWEEWRGRCTVPVPGKFSALYFLCENILYYVFTPLDQREPKLPLVEMGRSHGLT